MSQVVLQSELPDVKVKRGKVRDIYEFGDKLLFVATDRISAFDWVLPTGIPRKGEVLTRMSRFWFDRMQDIPNHFLSDDVSTLTLPEGVNPQDFAGRSMVVRKTEVVPIECVVRGYLAGSGWKEYQRSGTVCGIPLPEGLQESSQLPEPIFTPSTKAEEGHDENITYDQMVEIVGSDMAERLKELSLKIYSKGAEYALEQGIIIADTKFEFGVLDGELILIDEVLTPDSSRFWPQSEYQAGKGQPSYDKQFVRDWLEKSGWDKNSDPPALPDDVVQKTSEKYIEAYERLTQSAF
jgi:phosphoribosylaminoimidazole-succinocarboxamide synthase